MSGSYKALYRFEYGVPDAPHVLELRAYENETGYTVMRVPPYRAGVSCAWFKSVDDAKDFLISKVTEAIRH